MLMIGLLAGLATIVLGWGNLFLMGLGVIAVWTSGIVFNYSSAEIQNNTGPSPIVLGLAFFSGIGSILAVIYLLLT